MKKGIITFHNANNLGAVLQAYALQTKLSELYRDDEIEIIDYDNGFFKEKSKIKSLKGFLKNVYYFIKNNEFKRFRKKYLKLSKKYNSLNIKESNDNYDTFICGSDQIWNLSCSNYDYNYFLSFVDSNNKKISYAASIGTYSYTKEEKTKVLHFLSDYKMISIREKDSMNIFKDSKLKIDIMPDPVFLISKNEWLKIVPRKIVKKKYVFVYLIQDDINVMNAAKKYASEHNCKIISNKKSLKFIFNNSPDKFLSWIYYAEAIFTNSFHGTAFSLIFDKLLGADIELNNNKVNNRVNEILKLTKSTQCIIDSNNLNPGSNENYEMINELKEKGINFLKNI